MSKIDEPNAMELAPIAEARMIFEAKPQRTFLIHAVTLTPMRWRKAV